MRTIAACLLTATCAVLPALAHAAMGLAELPGLQGDGPVTVFYPTSAPETAVQRKVFTLSVALDGAPQPVSQGKARLKLSADRGTHIIAITLG